jgi:hypothetical protein
VLDLNLGWGLDIGSIHHQVRKINFLLAESGARDRLFRLKNNFSVYVCGWIQNFNRLKQSKTRMVENNKTICKIKKISIDKFSFFVNNSNYYG